MQIIFFLFFQVVYSMIMCSVIFFVVMINLGVDYVDMICLWCGDIVVLVCLVGKCVLGGNFICVCGFGFDVWDVLFGELCFVLLYLFWEFGVGQCVVVVMFGDILLYICVEVMDLCFEFVM